MPTQEDRTQAMLMWLLSLVIGFISPLIFMFVSKDREFVYRNTMQALAFGIALFILYAIVTVLAVVSCGIGALLYVIPGIIGIIVPIIGAITANNGAVYAPPISSQLARAWFKV